MPTCAPPCLASPRRPSPSQALARYFADAADACAADPAAAECHASMGGHVLGGAYANASSDASAFPFRDKLFILNGGAEGCGCGGGAEAWEAGVQGSCAAGRSAPEPWPTSARPARHVLAVDARSGGGGAGAVGGRHRVQQRLPAGPQAAPGARGGWVCRLPTAQLRGLAARLLARQLPPPAGARGRGAGTLLRAGKLPDAGGSAKWSRTADAIPCCCCCPTAQAIKAAYDPVGVFSKPYTVEPAAAGPRDDGDDAGGGGAGAKGRRDELKRRC